ncbi:MAG TPA: iron-containing alcohol dehydrogenase [Candidatus Angelobacter sp.]|nr:iron-containing alcohol dehydrogenase [Candidatus Angelobacter sp.]
MLPHGNWPAPTNIRFGVGRIVELPDACKVLGIGRPLLVTDRGLAAQPIVHDAIAGNERAGLPTGLFSGVRSNPNSGNVSDGVDAYRAGHHDGIIAMGGGSALDAGKTIALMAGQSRPLWDFVWGKPAPSDMNVAAIAPVVTVPTTAGTGSEVETGAVITDENTQTKEIITHPKMLAGIVIGDPALTAGLPPHLTAATGMDALSHCLEAYCVPDYDPMADGMALEGMRLIAEWLPLAVADGGNLGARTQMLAAAMIGAAAFRKGLGAMHALSHPIGAIYDTHHGLTNAVLMPYVLSFNRPAIGAKMERLARFLGLPAPSFDAVLAWILQLRQRVAIPHSLAAIGVDDGRADEVTRKAAADGNAPTNPVPVGAAELRGIFDRALRGAL